MERRDFFKSCFNKVTEVGVNTIDDRVEAKAQHWVRPPFAKSELDFLLACTRCNACIEVCPKNALFALPVRCGVEVAATPALDVLNNSCIVCEDWACVTACEDNALMFLQSEIIPDQGKEEEVGGEIEVEEESEAEVKIILPAAIDCPPFAKAPVNTEQCLPYNGPECGACRGSCPIPDTLTWENEKPSINLDTCIGCSQCREACITEPKAIDIGVIGRE